MIQVKFAGSTYSVVCMCICEEWGGVTAIYSLEKGLETLQAVCWQGFDPPAHVKPRFQSYTERGNDSSSLSWFDNKRRCAGRKFAAGAVGVALQN